MVEVFIISLAWISDAIYLPKACMVKGNHNNNYYVSFMSYAVYMYLVLLKINFIIMLRIPYMHYAEQLQ